MKTPVFAIGGLFCIVLFLNCHKAWEAPPLYTGPMLEANTSIRTLQQHHLPNNYEKILDDWIIEGVVTANDEKDNFYKSIVIQDSSAAITLRLDGYALYREFPVGKKIWVKLRGLWMGDYAGMIQLGGGVDRKDPLSPQLIAMPQPLFSRYIIKSAGQYVVQPRTITPLQLHDSVQGMLVSLHGVEFAASDTGKPFADALNQQAVSHTLKNCGPGNVYLRTSGFARFATVLTPRGNGSVTGIYTVFRTQKQILIRDTSDVQMNGLRCTVNGPKLLLQEDFSLVEADSILQLPGWKHITEIGGRYFLGKRSSQNAYAEIGAFATRQPVVITWLISPLIDLDHSANEVLRFATKVGFDNGAILQVLVSSQYDGGNTPWKAKWTVLPAQFAKGSLSGFSTAWVSSGDISLHSLKGRVYIAFRYEGNDPPEQLGKLTSSFYLDDIQVWGN